MISIPLCTGIQATTNPFRTYLSGAESPMMPSFCPSLYKEGRGPVMPGRANWLCAAIIWATDLGCPLLSPHTSCPLHKHPRHKTESPVCSLIVPLLLQWLLICHVQSTPHLTEQPHPTPSMTCHSLTLLCLNTFWLHSPSLDGEPSIRALCTLPRHVPH